LKLVLFSTVFAPSIGGVETLVGWLARGLALQKESGVELTVITSTPADAMDDKALPFRVVRHPGFRELVGLFRAADVIHLAGPSLIPMALAWLFRKPVALAHHGFQAVCPNGQLFFVPRSLPCPGHFMAGRHEKCWECNRSRGMLQSVRLWAATFPRRWLAARATVTVVPTQWLGGILQLPRTTVICHGVPTNGKAGGAPIPAISFLGRLVSSKGVSVLLQAAKDLQRRGLRPAVQIIGDGPERAALEKQAAELGLNGAVKFVGAVSNHELDSVLGRGITVVPSLGGEVFGLVVAQSMLAGRAVVASDLGSLAEVVGDAGVIFPAKDSARLADCLEELTCKPELRAQLGERAQRRAKELFGADRMIREHAALHTSLSTASKASPTK
jgi:glycosyltransferase involved in cell wall biosynthesis